MINDLAAGLKPYTQEELDAINGQQGGEFTRGMRSGTLSLRAGANNFTGVVADRLGFKDFARGEFAEADDLSLRAQQAAPRVSSVRDISSLRDFGDWGAGVAGQLVPSAALGIGAGLLAPAAAGVGGAMAAGTLAYAPSEIGEVIGRQRAAGQPTNLRDAALGGGASAALGAVVPGLVAGKLAGRALSTAPLTLARGARDVAGGALLEGGTEAGGEVTKQYATDRTLPTSDTLIDAGAAGALGGGAMSGLGVAGEAAHRGIAAPGKTLTTARDKVSALAGQAQEGLKSAAGATQQAVEDLSPSQKAADTLAGLSAKVKSSARDAIDRVEQGLPAGDLGALSAALQGKTGAARDAILAAADNETVQTVAKWAKDLSEDAGLTPERRTKLATAVQDMGSEASRATIAGLKKAHEASKDLGDSVNRLYESTKAWAEESDLKGKAKGLAAKGLDAAVRGVDKVQDMVDRARFKRGAGGDGDVVDMPEATPARKALPGVKKSEDFAGIRRVVMEHVAPALQEVNPGVLEDQANLPKVADSIRMFIEQVAKREPGQLPSDTVVHLIDLFGDKTTDVLDRVHRAVMGEDRGQAENFFGALNQIREMQKKDTDLLGIMRQNLKPALQAAYTMPELRLMAQELSGWMQRAPGGKSQQDIFFDQKVMQQLGETFDKPDAVIAALTEIAKDTKLQQDKSDGIETDEDGNPSYTDGVDYADVLNEQGPRQALVSDKLVTDPAAHRAEYGNEGQAERFIREAKARDAGLEARWIPAEEWHAENSTEMPEGAKGKGYVVAEKMAGSDKLDAKGVEKFKFDTKKGNRAESKSVVPAGEGLLLDAMKLARRRGGEEIPYSAEDDASYMHRLAKQFFANVAAVQESLGREFDLDPLTVVTSKGGREITVNDLERVRVKKKGAGEKLQALRERFAAARKADDTEAMTALQAEAKKLQALIDRELGTERIPRETALDEEIRKRGGRMDPDPINNDVVTAAARMSPADMVHTFNMDGTPVSQTPRNSPREMMARNKAMAQNRREILAKDLPKPLGKPARAAPPADLRVMTIEQETAYRKALAKGDVIRANAIKFAAEQGAPPSPKAVAAKKAAFLEKARSGDAELLKTLAKSDDAKGLQRAAQALKGEQGEGITRTADTINKRLGELVQDDETRYGMQLGKKYSLMGLRVHEELGRPGFAATHDSPIRHEGKFDWRAHQGKGEGHAAFGAGTYLSAAEGVHKSYKSQFTAKAEREAPQSAYVQSLRDEVNENSDALLGLMQERDELGKWRARIGGRIDHFDTQEAARAALDDYRQGRLDRLAALKQKLVDKVNPDGLEYNISAIRKDIAYIEDKLLETDGNQPERLQDLIDETTEAGRAMLKRYEDAKAAQPNTKSPTYEVSVDIPQDQLLDWNAPLREQQAQVRSALEKDKHAVDAYDVQFNMGMGVGLDATATGEDIYRALKAELGSARAASDYLQSLGILGHKYNASGGKNDTHPNYVIYDDSRITTNYVHFSKGFVDPQNATTSNARSQVLGYINTVLGQSVQVAFKKFADMPHAGEFEPQSASNPADVIRISVHALNPLGTAYHESLHAWFKQLSAAGLTDVMKPLLRAADGVVVRRQLERLLAHEPGALSQLHDAEERVAYMYQFWSTGQLKVGPDTKTIFNKIADFIREVLGIWSNDTRAEKIMEYFHEGDYKRDMNSPSAITKATLDAGRNKAVTTLRNMADPLVRLTNEVATAGGQRLRDTGIPALNELANLVKATGRDEQKDPGFIPAARNERARVMNQLGAALHGVSKAHVAEALEALQKGQRATSLEARTAAIMVKKILSDSKAYMQAAGVNVSDLGPDYFPRVYDTSYISRHQDEFVTVLEAHGVSNAREIMLKLVSADGNEFRIEAPMPGMQNLKERKLAFVPDEVLEPFMRKDLFEIMNSYVTQATRRAEWARRFEADGSKLRALMEQAERQGATSKEIAAAEKYVKAVDGTLGDDINPTARRVMGDMIVYQNIRLLPLAIFSSIVDPNGILVRGGTVGDAFSTFKRGIREMAKNFQKDPKSDAATEFAELIGTVDRAAMAHTIGSAYTQGMVGDTGRKVNDLFFRYNLMEQFNTSMRVGATQAALKFIVRHKDGTRSPHSARWIKELGLEPADIQVDAFGELKVLPSQGLTEAQSAKIKMAINRWVDGAVLRPDAADKPPWMSDPHWALIAHLKQFTFAFHETIIKRVVHEYQNGNYSPAMALAGYVPIMIAADMVKGLIQGGGEEPEWKQNWTASDYIWSGVQRGGLLGTGQFAVDMAGDVRDGGIGVGALSGPTIEQLADAVRVLDGREQFDHFAIKSMPANALYATAFGGEATDPAFSE